MQAVPPLGEVAAGLAGATGDLIRKISERAKVRGVTTIKDNMFGQPIERDYANAYEAFTLNGAIRDTPQLVEFMLEIHQPGLPKGTWEEFPTQRHRACRMIPTDVQFGARIRCTNTTRRCTARRDKHPWKTHHRASAVLH